MAISKWNPFGNNSDDDVPSRRSRTREPFRQLQQDVNRLFEDFFNRSSLRRRNGERTTPAQAGFRPRIDVSEDEETFKVQAELPGLDKDDIELEADDSGVTIRGEKSYETEKEDEGFYRSERSYGYFQRNIPFPMEVDTEGARAVFEDGVLDVRFPKREETGGETLEIE